MKNAFRLSVLLLFCPVFASGQARPVGAAVVTPKITVSKIKWREEVLMRVLPSSVADAEIGMSGPPDSRRIYAPPPVRKVFAYQAEFFNQGGEKVKGVVWELVTASTETKQELNRRKFVSRKTIGANKRRTLRALSGNPPALVAEAGSLEKERSAQYDFSVKILCVMLEDGKIWRDRSVPHAACLGLRRRR